MISCLSLRHLPLVLLEWLGPHGNEALGAQITAHDIQPCWGHQGTSPGIFQALQYLPRCSSIWPDCLPTWAGPGRLNQGWHPLTHTLSLHLSCSTVDQLCLTKFHLKKKKGQSLSFFNVWHCAYVHELKPSGRNMARSWGVLAFTWVLLGLFMAFVWNLSVVFPFIQDYQRNFFSFTQNQSCHRSFFLVLCCLGLYICWKGNCVTLSFRWKPHFRKDCLLQFGLKTEDFRDQYKTFLDM